MPWQNNGGNGDRPNPWGGGGSGGRNEPPQFDDFIKKGQDQLKSAMPGGAGGVVLIVLVMIALWLASGLYRVETNEQGVVMRFGKYVDSTAPGLHWHLPYPIETVEVRGVTDEQTIEIGVRGASNRSESLMLTSDENIVDVRFNVVWRIADLGNYLFNLADPQQTVKSVAESVMRELVGKERITPIITTARGTLQSDALLEMQNILDTYESGITVLRVQIIESEAPDEVKDAFLDVQRAEADQQRLMNEAEQYRNRIIPEAKGRAQQLVNQAEAYKAEVVARATGESARFLSVYEQYVAAKDVTRKRLYLETMEEILAGMDKIVIDGDAGSGVVPYLPLDQLTKKKSEGEE
ncbi:protease modulator HflK [Kordiimonas sediminis]|uniref:Protein HflK n=1 Tax=Kordiimonas sediminis TaxID=1735581 RepID=A0A919EAQ2_9PROT|nr:FtsH protease activity modulator HflK [Kordiimonas sediminis]GHF30737.1 protease modulator HflK [Kordiimonas sediminis]